MGIVTPVVTRQPPRSGRWCLGAAAAAVVLSQAPVDVAAQVQMGNSRVRVVAKQTIETLQFELHAVNDDVTLYAGGPRELMLLEVRPHGIAPRVDLSPGSHPTLRVRDRSIYDRPVPDDLYADSDPYEEDLPEERVPESQSWETMLSAMIPTDFYLDIEKGEGRFDFTDMFVQNLRVSAHFARTTLEFSRPNEIELDRVQFIADEGEVEFRDILNARPKRITIQTQKTECDIQISGEPFEGAAEIYLTGTAKRMHFLVSRQIGLRVEGPAAIVGAFDTKDMERRGLALYSRGYEDQTCTVLLHFSGSIENLDVEWD